MNRYQITGIIYIQRQTDRETETERQTERHRETETHQRESKKSQTSREKTEWPTLLRKRVGNLVVVLEEGQDLDPDLKGIAGLFDGLWSGPNPVLETIDA